MWRRGLIYVSRITNKYWQSPIHSQNCVNKCCTSVIFADNQRLLRRNITSTCSFNSVENLRKNPQNAAEEVKSEDNCNSFTIRSHNCGELRPDDVGKTVSLCGWVQYVRLSKFILLRDSYGLVQCITGDKDIDFSSITLESVVKIDGTVVLRPKEMTNSKMSTGDIEVVITDLKVLNEADNLPFNLREYQKPKEQLRLQYRYLDLRFPDMQHNLRLRSSVLHKMRKFLIEKHSFVEVETPTLFCRTPGGAREFVVPTHHFGLFYSLVQSPQQFKQMLMAGGVDRYFQVARCYRDETTRPDRQPEFTQLDIELSFTNRDGVLSLIESLLLNSYGDQTLQTPFKRLTYKEAIENYGTDKPNISYDLKLKNIKHLFTDNSNDDNFEAYALPYTSELGKLTTKVKDEIREISKKYNTKIVLQENMNKVFGNDFESKIQHFIGNENSSIICVGNDESVCLSLGLIREYLFTVLKSKNLIKVNDDVTPIWVVEFPLFVKGENGLETCHHPFTAPHPEDMHLLDSDPLKVRSLAYDLVMKGNEVGGGSVRIHNVALQEKVLNMLKIEPSTLSHFLNALKSGCPPHAGIALGMDRLISIACNTESIRDVIAFPKSHEGKDPLSGAPNTISDDDKEYYHIRIK